MDVTRRDALAALAVLGVTASTAGCVAPTADDEDSVGGAATGTGTDEGDGDSSPDEEAISGTLTAAAEVLYPSEVDGIAKFVDTFTEGRLDDGPHAEGLAAAISELDDRAESWYDGPFADLDTDDRDSLLREVGADTAEEHPNGSTAELVRYYVVNELLLTLYASPTVGELIGIENPQGHAGGIDSYRQGPDAADGRSTTLRGGPNA